MNNNWPNSKRLLQHQSNNMKKAQTTYGVHNPSRSYITYRLGEKGFKKDIPVVFDRTAKKQQLNILKNNIVDDEE